MARVLLPATLLLLTQPLTASARTTVIPYEIEVGKNIQVAAGARPDWPQREPAIAVDPRNPQVLAAAFIDYRLVPLAMPKWGHGWLALYRSSDGGRSWKGGLLPGYPGDNSSAGLASPLRPFNLSANTEVQFDGAGNLYLSGAAGPAGTPGTILHFCRSGTVSGATFVAEYSNDGATYVRETIVKRGCLDYPRMAVDTSAGPTRGNIYQLVTVSYATVNGTSQLFRSTDGGLSFHPMAKLQGVSNSLVVTPGGEVVAVTSTCVTCSPNVEPTLVYTSTDGARTFGPPVTAFVQHVGILPVTVASVLFDIWAATDRHSIFMVYNDMAGNHSEIKLVRSTDGGLTWSAPLVLNGDRDGQAFLPSVAVGPEGIGVAWYDARNGLLANGSIAGIDVYLTVSTDGGKSFSRDVRVSNVTSDPNLVMLDDANQSLSYLVYLGDYLGIAATPHGWHVLWTDNRNACSIISQIYGCVDQDLYTAEVSA